MPETRPADSALDDRDRLLDESSQAAMAAFRDFDAATFRASHDPRAVTVFADGQVTAGIDAIMDRLADHFSGREAVWSWLELGRVVDGQAAFVYYMASYELPSQSIDRRQLVSVTWAWRDGRWRAIGGTNTLLR